MFQTGDKAIACTTGIIGSLQHNVPDMHSERKRQLFFFFPPLSLYNACCAIYQTNDISNT